MYFDESYNICQKKENKKLSFTKKDTKSCRYKRWVFYLETSKYLKTYASCEKNVLNKNFIFLKEKSDSANIDQKPYTLRVRAKEKKFTS